MNLCVCDLKREMARGRKSCFVCGIMWTRVILTFKYIIGRLVTVSLWRGIPGIAFAMKSVSVADSYCRIYWLK